MSRTKLAVVALGALLALACSQAGDKDEAPGQATGSPAVSAGSSTPATTKSSAPEVAPSVLESRGIPPYPDAATEAAFASDMNAINPLIIGKKEPRSIVNRGRDQCRDIGSRPNDRPWLIDRTNKRFTAPGYSEGFGLGTAEKILDAVHARLCPSYPMKKA
jgi:hypothetical protein